MRQRHAFDKGSQSTATTLYSTSSFTFIESKKKRRVQARRFPLWTNSSPIALPYLCLQAIFQLRFGSHQFLRQVILQLGEQLIMQF